MKSLPPLSGPRAQSILPSRLQPGDVILSTTPSRTSGLIRRVTHAPVSHAMLYLGNGQVIEAVSQGVVIRGLQAALGTASLAVVYRHADMTPGLGLAAASVMLQHVGRPYDYKGALTSWNKDSEPGLLQCGRLAAPDAWFCSELVVAAYQAAGLDLSAYSAACSTPGDLLQGLFTNALDYQGHLVTDPSVEHDFSVGAPVESAQEHGIPTQTQTSPARDGLGSIPSIPEGQSCDPAPTESAGAPPFGGVTESLWSAPGGSQPDPEGFPVDLPQSTEPHIWEHETPPQPETSPTLDGLGSSLSTPEDQSHDHPASMAPAAAPPFGGVAQGLPSESDVSHADSGGVPVAGPPDAF